MSDTERDPGVDAPEMVECPQCQGVGLVHRFNLDGQPFDDCPRCHGSGTLAPEMPDWVDEPQDDGDGQ